MFDQDHLRTLRYDPEVSNHLDRVMSLAIAYEMRNYTIPGGDITITEEAVIEGVHIQ